MCTQIWYNYRLCHHIVFQFWADCDTHQQDNCPRLATRTLPQDGQCETCAYPTPPDSAAIISSSNTDTDTDIDGMELGNGAEEYLE